MKFQYTKEKDSLLGEIIVLTYEDDDPQKSIAVKISPTYGSNIFSFIVGDSELMWCDKNMLVEKKAQGAFTGNFVVAPIGANREYGQEGFFEDQYLDFRDIPKPEGDVHLVHGFARLLEWSVGNMSADDEHVVVDTYVRYGKDTYSKKAYPYDVTHTQRHVLTKKGLQVFAIFENKGDRNAPVAHTLHADMSTKVSGPDKTFITVPAEKHITTKQLIPVYPLELTSVVDTVQDLRNPTAVSSLWIDDYYTGLDPSIPAVYDPTTKHFKIEITASSEYQHFVVFTQRQDDFVALERQTNMPTALKALKEGFGKEANIVVVPPHATKTIWTAYAVVYK